MAGGTAGRNVTNHRQRANPKRGGGRNRWEGNPFSLAEQQSLAEGIKGLLAGEAKKLPPTLWQEKCGLTVPWAHFLGHGWATATTAMAQGCDHSSPRSSPCEVPAGTQQQLLLPAVQPPEPLRVGGTATVATRGRCPCVCHVPVGTSLQGQSS